MADKNRQYWNQQFKILQDTWPKPVAFERCVEICLEIHAMVHSGAVSEDAGRSSGTIPCSFEDEMWEGMTAEAFRRYHEEDQSIAWKMWHAARIEDMTMNVLIDGGQQVFNTGSWYGKLKVAAHDTGNVMNGEEITELSNSIDMNALREYRNAVGRRTREIIMSLKPEDLKRKVDPARLAILMREGDIVQEASRLADYWGGKTYSGLLLMPATRHILVHLNESMRLLKKVK
jgi:hypothetical protein